MEEGETELEKKEGEKKRKAEKKRIMPSHQHEPSPESKMSHTSGPVLGKRESIIYPGACWGRSAEIDLCW